MRQFQTYTASTVGLVFTILCSSIEAETAPQRGISEGVWGSDGYGYILNVMPDRHELFHLAGGTCFRDDDASSDVEALLKPDTIHMSPNEDHFGYSNKFEPHRIIFSRQPTLPAPCLSPVPDTFAGNFQAFADIFAAHYAFFDLYGVNWEQQVHDAQQRLSSEMTEPELFQLFADMIAPLQDGHLELVADIDGSNYTATPKTTPLSRGVATRATALEVDEGEIFMEQLEAYWVDGISSEILRDAGTDGAGGKIQYGVVDGNIGYIAVLMLTGFTQDGPLAISDDENDDEEYAAVNQIMDEIMVSFAEAGVKSVIIDASINFGGNDYMGREIAARFAFQEHIAYTKHAFDAQGTSETPVFIRPSERPSFDGPVYLMTTQSTVSAGEIMTLSLRALPNVTHVGQSTQGALSDILNKSLPNGWQIGMSNEVYYDHNNLLWEGRGIPPEQSIEVFSEKDLVANHPAAVRLLVAQIHEEHPH
ncbi:S41 family peptidase [Thalassobius sp. I31.1]|uniref:S41 family peptidase n=1 Tax=Thalassobius sp. I31.1 TaxID=2109912 RepID=UPI000D19BB74|nr:S41 family peptidase [Thalassobius sp. I31.1]